MSTVWGVFLWRRDRGASYDLQAVGSTEATARELAATHRPGPWRWIELSTGRHWVAVVDGVAMMIRVSAIELDRTRDARDSDPPDLYDETAVALATLERAPLDPSLVHGDSQGGQS